MDAILNEEKKDKKDNKQKKNGKLAKHLSDEALAAADLAVGDVKAKSRKIKNDVYEKELAKLQLSCPPSFFFYSIIFFLSFMSWA